jgi:hypothetical protein
MAIDNHEDGQRHSGLAERLRDLLRNRGDDTLAHLAEGEVGIDE